MEGSSSAAAAATENKTDNPQQGKIVTAGQPTRGEFPRQQQSTENGNAGEDPNASAKGAGEGAGEPGNEGANSGAEGSQNGNQKMSDDDLKKILEERGIKVESLEDLKPKEQPKELTPEEKEAADKEMEKRMLDTFVANGGTVENFVALKRIAETDLTQLSTDQIKHELKENGFTDSEINSILVERYYQINPEEVEQGVDETDEEFKARQESIKKKVEYGAKKIASRGQLLKDKASGALNDLREAIKAEDEVAQREREYSSIVDEYFTKLPRKMSLSLGLVNDKELPPVDIDIPEAAVEEVRDIMRDPQKRKQFFFNEDNTFNLEKIGQVLLRNQLLEHALKSGIIEGGTQQVAEFEKRFPGAATGLGLGTRTTDKSGNGREGVITKAGSPEVSRPANK